jgi:hypothetical protein
MPNYNTRNEYNGDQYSTLLVQHYTKQLTVSHAWILFSSIVVSCIVSEGSEHACMHGRRACTTWAPGGS